MHALHETVVISLYDTHSSFGFPPPFRIIYGTNLSSSANFLERHYRTITCVERYFLPVEEGAGSSDDDFFGDTEAQESQARSEERDLKSELLRKYGDYLRGLKQEFSKKKKKKKGKLPKEARQTMLDWWTLHYKWPYPTVASSLPLSLQP